MTWLFGRLDRLFGTIVSAIAGLAASQTQAFILAYLQRLGGHRDEARLAYVKLQAGEFLPGTVLQSQERVAQERLADAFGRRADELSQAYNAIANAEVFERPLRFVTHMDRTIAEATLTNFTPSLPLDGASLIFALTGMVLGWLLYEIVKLPFRAITRPRHRGA